MEFERIQDPFTFEEKVFVIMSAEEFRHLRFDMSLACSYVENLDALDNFLYDSEYI